MFVQEYRAAKILYNFLKSNDFKKPFLLPSNVCSVLPLTFYMAGVEFDFLDIQSDNFCINQQQVFKKADDYQGVLFVRTYGIENDFSDFFEKIKVKNNDFVVIDDSCLNLPNLSYVLEKNIDLKLFSIGYGKQIAFESGGFGFINEQFRYKNYSTDYVDGSFQEYERKLKNSIINKLTFTQKQYHFLDNIEFEISPKSIEERIDLVKKHKSLLNQIYADALPKEIQMKPDFQNWRFQILVEEEKKKLIFEKLFENKLFASSHYYPISMVWKNQEAPESMKLYKNVINLFNDLYYIEQQAIETCKVINSII